MRFAYIGDHDATTVLGLSFIRGAATEVHDERAIRKLSANPDFALVVDAGDVEVMPAEPKRRGRPPKAQ